MKNKGFAVVVILLTICCLCGCTDQQIFEETSIIIYAGVEKKPAEETTSELVLRESSNKIYHYTFAIAAEKQYTGFMHFITAEGTLMSDAIEQADQEAIRPLKNGKMQGIIISKDLAKEGLRNLTDNNQISTINRFLPDYIISEISPNQLLKTLADMDLGNNSFTFINDLVENAAESGICPSPRKHKTSLMILNRTIDPLIPMIGVDGDNVAVTGTALFRDDVYVDALNMTDSRFLNFMVSDYNEAVIALPFASQPSGSENQVSFFVTKSRHGLKVSRTEGGFAAKITVEFHGYVDEMVWQTIHQEVSLEEFTAASARHIRDHLESVVSITQALAVDPYGIQEQLRAFHGEYLENIDFREALRTAPIVTEVSVYLTNDSNTH